MHLSINIDIYYRKALLAKSVTWYTFMISLPNKIMALGIGQYRTGMYVTKALDRDVLFRHVRRAIGRSHLGQIQEWIEILY